MFDIIVPIYRISEELILKALDSIKAQTLTDYEVYVCDGTPTEHQTYDAQAVVECYGFNYIRQAPSHPLVGGARNQAVSMGSNPYLAFLDGDDYWYDGYLFEMKKAIEDSNERVKIWSVVLDCEYPLISQFTGATFQRKGLYAHWEDQTFLENHPDYAYYWFFGHPPAPTGTIIDREAFLAVGGYDTGLGMGEDTELLMRIVGDPRKTSERNHYSHLPLICGFHYIGEENTCSFGTQSGVSRHRSPDDIKAFFASNSLSFSKIHPRPTIEDLPTPVSDSFIETLKGVMRNQIHTL
jgi:glycosyltransferase involved in cell wall biosynthesis|tara:strand:- start:142 stop:1026 length:885 start_codon:yes stop_codon:yes gene_type:complete